MVQFGFIPVGVDTPAPGPDNTFLGIGGLCPEGTECPEGSTYPSVCPPGKYSPNTGLAACFACPAGETKLLCFCAAAQIKNGN